MTEAESVKLIQFSHPGDTVHIYPIGDVHLGSVFCDEKELRRVVQAVKDDLDAYVILMGDMLDMTTRNSVGDIWSQTLTPWQQIDRAAELLEPIKDRIIAVTEGNHEDRAFKFDGLLPMRQVAMQLHLDPTKVYAPCAGLIDVRLDVPSSSAHMTIYFKHGYGGGRTMGAKANRMKDLKNEVLADVLIMGHTHEQMAFTSSSCIPRTNKGVPYLDEIRHLHINSNSFLSWGGYAVKQGYAPGFTGCPVLELMAKRTSQGVDKHASVRIST
jgi:predicted phosphodiesterase